jgi:hypothetical protein
MKAMTRVFNEASRYRPLNGNGHKHTAEQLRGHAQLHLVRSKTANVSRTTRQGLGH